MAEYTTTSLASSQDLRSKTIVQHLGEVDYILMAGKYYGLVKIQSHEREYINFNNLDGFHNKILLIFPDGSDFEGEIKEFLMGWMIGN